MSRQQPFFSIIIPALNEAAYLPFLLKDLSGQTFAGFEIVVVDAQSNDGTTKVAQKFKKVKVLTSPKANVAFQRNLGGQEAKGKYLLFIDADTRIPPYFLEGLKYRLVTSKAQVFTTWVDKDNVRGADRAIIVFLNFALETGRFFENPGAYGALLGCKKSAFTNFGGFDPTIAFAEDAEFVQRLVKHGCRYGLFRDPRFTYSLRRFRKEGTLPLIRNYTRLYLDWITNGFPKGQRKEYPMLGGAYYLSKKPYPQFLTRFDKALEKIKKIRDKKVLKRFLENFFLG